MFRLSLREMLVFVAMFALAIASLKYANDTWVALVAGVTMLTFFAALIVAVVDRGPRQAFAIGFTVTLFAYFAAVLTGLSTAPGRNNAMLKNIEFDQWEGRLPTTRLLRYAHSAVETSGYYDNATGKVLPNYDPAKSRNSGGGGFGRSWPGVSFREIPPREKFMPIGHFWWALIFGYAGGHFARFVYWRRLRDEQKLPAETS